MTDPVALLEKLPNKWRVTASALRALGERAQVVEILTDCADELEAAIALMRAPVGDVKESEIVELVAGPYMYHHKMDDHAMREGKAFDRCRELTIQNVQTFFAMRAAMREASK